MSTFFCGKSVSRGPVLIVGRPLPGRASPGMELYLQAHTIRLHLPNFMVLGRSRIRKAQNAR